MSAAKKILEEIESGSINSESSFEKVWILEGLFNSAPCLLEFNKDKFKLTLLEVGTFSESKLDSLCRKFGVENASESISESTVELVDINEQEIKHFKLPWYNFGAGVSIEFENDLEIKLSLVQPQNTKFPMHKIDNTLIKVNTLASTANDLKYGISLGKQLKRIFNT